MKLKVRKKVVISCVTFETVKITKPIGYLQDVKRVYLLHWGESSGEKENGLYEKFYNEVVRQLRDDPTGPQIEDIREKRVKVFLFQDVLRELLKILCVERDEENEIFINVSGGTSEYGAAATIAAMMVPEVIPFTVSTREYMVSGKDVKIYFDSKRPVGLAKDVKDPYLLPTFKIDLPPKDLVKGLGVLREKLKKGHLLTYTKMIKGIEEAGAWMKKEHGKPKYPAQSKKMYYARHFVDHWLDRGWVKRDKRGELTITDAGKMVTDVFYKE